ncbi:transporter substrate-binding domain-containing protein [Pantoea sp.]|uniref:transporter substrate-binding domain-containing protein n=1 Tax=Pantoea sp. TaxID=69393 RepID=UPI0031D18BA7
MRFQHCLAVVTMIFLMLFPAKGKTENLTLLSRVSHASAPSLLSVPALSVESQQWIKQHPVLRLGVMPQQWPPFTLLTNRNELQGISADYVDQITQMLGLTVEVTQFSSEQEVWKALQSGQIDAISTVTSWQAPEFARLTKPYVTAQSVIAVPLKQQQQPGHYLTDRTVAMARGYMPEALFKRYYPLAKLHIYDNYQDAISAVAFGRADVYFGDAYPVSRNFLNNLRIAQYSIIPDTQISFAFNDKNVVLYGLFNQALASLPENFSYDVLQRWLPGRGGLLVEGQPIPLSDEEQQWIKKHPQVNVLTLQNYAPLSFVDGNGSVRGIGPEVLSMVALRTGLNFRFDIADDVASMVSQVADKKADMLVSLTPSEARRETLLFTRSYLRNAFVLVVRKENQQINLLSDLKGKKLGIITGTDLEKYLHQHYPDIKLVSVSDANQVMSLLDKKRVDAVVNTLANSEYQLLSHYSDELKIVNTVGESPAYISFAIAKDEPILRDIIDKVLLAIPPDELDLIGNRWRPNNMVIEDNFWRQHRTAIITLLSIALILILLGVIWTLYLRRQITLKEQAQEAFADQNKKMRQLLDGAPFPMFIRDNLGRLIDCNQHYLDIVKLEKSQALGRTLLEEAPFHQQQDAQRVHQIFMRVMSSDMPYFAEEIFDFHPNTGETQFKAYFSWFLPYRDGSGHMAGVLGGWMDTTERAQVTEALRVAKDQAEEASRTKSTFLSTMSHEIRTPMNAIIGMIDIAIQRGKRGELDLQALEVAAESADGLVELIGDILDISRIESGRVELEPKPANIVNIARNVINTFKGLALQKHISLSLIEPKQPVANIEIDTLRIKQVMANLLSNAIKFTDDGGVTFEVIQRVNAIDKRAEVVLVVKDTGIGIPIEQQTQLFQPFAQANNRRQGTGLGLYISHSLCRMMNGDIALESQPGQGTCATATVSVPLADAIPAEIILPSYPAYSPASMQVLIVDDNTANRLLMRKQLTHLGHQVSEAVEGESALALFKQQSWDMVITDCNMPGMDGYQLTRAVREFEQANNRTAITIIGFTADAMSEARERCLAAGMNGCLFKPCTLEDVRKVLMESAAPVFDLSSLGDDDALRSQVISQLQRSNHHYQEELSALLEAEDTLALRVLTLQIRATAQQVNAHFMMQACDVVQHSDSAHSLQAGQKLQQALKTFEVMLQKYQAVLHVTL